MSGDQSGKHVFHLVSSLHFCFSLLALKHFFFFFVFFLDRSGYYKKCKFDVIDKLVSEDVQPAPQAARDVNPPSTSMQLINLVPNEVLGKKKCISPLKIYVGNNIYVEVKEYKKNFYVGFSKEEDGTIRNRFNIALEQLDKVEEALNILKEYVRNSN